MSVDACYELVRLLLIKKPRTILEFGVGFSTAVLSEYITTCPLVTYLGIETGPTWISRAPDSNRMFYETDADAISGNASFDLVVVDGPYGGRKHLIPLLKRVAIRNVVIDDTHRPEEMEIAAALKLSHHAEFIVADRDSLRTTTFLCV